MQAKVAVSLRETNATLLGSDFPPHAAASTPMFQLHDIELIIFEF
jgi:hypothetical protein